MINIIVAIDKNNAIGKNGDMPWHISTDLKYFKATTLGAAVIMGRRTWQSLGCRPLPKRRNIVVSSTLKDAPGAEIASNLEEFIQNWPKDELLFVIGGGEIYKATIKYADKLYITHVNCEVEGADTFFPEIDRDIWEIESDSGVIVDEGSNLEIIFRVYKRY